ncbi:hypothetical protein EKM05_09500 [Flavobacterium sp. GSP27]|uniref:hypothetical protein n=1 Tax=unclassified Flavobacterium TaxID=196869 RepID=UPI000F839681|nr:MULTISPECIES: hypothetical protein [unclassified Flavobacterium]RTY71431.1 hypothetical protein EKL95_01615 [Flavobacterium sp. LB2P53]RTY95639.1 hypothetical protein EKL32_06445 [Flavobacterium sp. GSN2]RTZ08815.1 hypothetical protein EKM05_09500 [Flavobacterium sp. GSP27]
MKTLIIVLSVFLAVNSIASAQEAVKSSQKETHKAMYSCSMHPKEMSDKSVKYPKCGMQMTPKASDTKEENHQH